MTETLGAPSEEWRAERQTIVDVILEMVGQGLVAGSSGNASMRLPGDRGNGSVLITPARRPYRLLRADDLVVIDLDGEPVEGDRVPSTEAATHLALYKSRPEVGAVLHTHSVYASVAAVAGLEVPPLVDEMVVKIGGSVRVAKYAFPSTEDLARSACDALGDRNAVLLRNHGLVGVGRTAWEALEVCQLVERVAHIYVYASLLGKAVELPPEIVEMERELYLMQRAAVLSHAADRENEGG